MGPHPAVAACRSAVRRCLADLDPLVPLVVACSGGADSLALLAATVFETRRRATPVHGVSVDHGLQPGSRERADAVAVRMRGLGATTGEVATAHVGGPGGPEAAARAARYAALDAAAQRHGAAAVLLGHTRDDQAETVLLGLARGSGARSLSAMAPVAGRYRRPFLGLGRSRTRAACEAEDLPVWDDPHNLDPAFARVRVRRRVLPLLEEELGPGVGEALARTARQLREDADALDALALAVLDAARTGPGGAGGLDVGVLAARPAALRKRALRRAALDAGSPATDLSAVHVDAVDALVTDWHGQQGVDLPGPVAATRGPGADPGGAVIRFVPGPVAG